MRNFVIGTAGHVDHGKTSLIKSITGIDTDRLTAEKTRGITIENGFAELIDGSFNISIIDVPGHEKFIKNMLSGIGGIDLVLLIVALDEGIMPQTVEHFEIVKMLNINSGIIVLTKNDVTDDEEWKELVEMDAAELVKGSFLEDAPVIRVSAKTGYNLQQLKDVIVKELSKIPSRDLTDNPFRLPIDRVFTIAGFGTVVTGTLLEGRIKVGDEVAVYPNKGLTRVRNVQVHNEPVSQACAGQRTAINLGGLKKEDISRGDVLACIDSMKTVMMLDVKIKMFDSTQWELVNGSRVHFYCEATEALCKVVLLDKNRLTNGEAGYAQLRFEEPVAFKRKDRFIIRFYSPVMTIGGGIILDAEPIKHKRFKQEIINELSLEENGTILDIVELSIKRCIFDLVDIRDIARRVNISRSDCEACINVLIKDGKVIMLDHNMLIHKDNADYFLDIVINIIKEHYKGNPLSLGMKIEELRSRISYEANQNELSLVEACLGYAENDGVIKKNDNYVTLCDYKQEIPQAWIDLKENIIRYYKEKKFEMPKLDELYSFHENRKAVVQVVDLLEQEGHLVKIDYPYYIDIFYYSKAVEILKRIVNKKGYVSLSEFRDAIGTSRKYAIMILNYFDNVGLTIMTGDVRILN